MLTTTNKPAHSEWIMVRLYNNGTAEVRDRMKFYNGSYARGLAANEALDRAGYVLEVSTPLIDGHAFGWRKAVCSITY